MDISPISMPNLAFDLAFHPKAQIVAAGTITGEVLV